LKIQVSGIWHSADWLIFTGILEEIAVSIIRVQEAQEEWINLFKHGSNGK
jgi:hypothetical protein